MTARALAAVVLAALLCGGCTSSPHMTTAGPAKPAPVAPPSTSVPTSPVSAPTCSAAQGSLVPSAPQFTNSGRLIQPFGYVNQGPLCYEEGFPAIQLYNEQHQPLNIADVDGDVVLGAAVPTRFLLQHDDQTSGFNIETPTSGSCETASYASASFGGGSTPPVAINYQVCGTLYVTTIFQ
jgi:hypothetical protein